MSQQSLDRCLSEWEDDLFLSEREDDLEEFLSEREDDLELELRLDLDPPRDSEDRILDPEEPFLDPEERELVVRPDRAASLATALAWEAC